MYWQLRGAEKMSGGELCFIATLALLHLYIRLVLKDIFRR